MPLTLFSKSALHIIGKSSSRGRCLTTGGVCFGAEMSRDVAPAFAPARGGLCEVKVGVPRRPEMH